MITSSQLAKLFSVWFGAGLSPKAPGTIGSLVTLPMAWLILQFSGQTGLCLAIILISVLGIWAADKYSKDSGQQDPGCIVIDEVAGQMIPCLIAPLTLTGMGLAFILFRMFDIIKPFPVCWFDRHVHGGLGVMADDLCAGIMAAIVLWGIQQWITLPMI